MLFTIVNFFFILGPFSSHSLSFHLQYFNQILTVTLEVLDNSDSSVRELALSLITEMIKNQVS